MVNKNSFLIIALWRLAPIIVTLIWVTSYIFQFYPKGTYSYEYMIINPSRIIFLVILICVTAIIVVAFPYKFYIHGFFCWSFGLLWLIDGGLVTAILIHLVGYAFLYRQGFFKKFKLVKLIVGGVILIGAIVSQLRITDIDFFSRIFHFTSAFIVIILTAVVLRSEVLNIKKNMQEKTFIFSSPFLKEIDIVIIRKILSGKKI